MEQKYKNLFWKKVEKTNKCWIWKGGISGRGYGNFVIRQGKSVKNYRAHRFSFLISTGKLPNKKMICHKCDNTLCVRPSHLFLGDATVNALDMVKKGRANPPRGERAGTSKLTAKDILKIFNLKEHGLNHVEISKHFPVVRQLRL